MSTSGRGGEVEHVDGEALDWALRMAEPDADWDAFTAWLEEDERRAVRYDAAAAALMEMSDAVARQARPLEPPANDLAPPVTYQARARHGRRLLLGGAMAAAIAGTVVVGVWQQRDQSYVVATRPGEQRIVELDDGSRIALAGGSRVRLDRAKPRTATVEVGEMLFTVRHDEDAPFQVRAGEIRLVDLGTVFNVRMLGAETRVAVADGAVMVDRKGSTLRLDPGQGMSFDGETMRRERQEVASVGEWRSGLLSFSDATYVEVAEELTRHLGYRFTSTPALKARTFNGTLEVAAVRRDPTLLGSLLGVGVRRDGDDWKLEERR